VKDYPQRLHHDTPAWVKTGELFHVRIRIDAAQVNFLTEPSLSKNLIDAAKRYHELGRWWCEIFLLMPDHIHTLLRFRSEPGMAVVVGNWKRGTARFQDVHWQNNFFDHRIRNKAEAGEKYGYIRRNPVIKGLCAVEGDWPHSWSAGRDRE
jgi:putative transposase